MHVKTMCFIARPPSLLLIYFTAIQLLCGAFDVAGRALLNSATELANRNGETCFRLWQGNGCFDIETTVDQSLPASAIDSHICLIDQDGVMVQINRLEISVFHHKIKPTLQIEWFVGACGEPSPFHDDLLRVCSRCKTFDVFVTQRQHGPGLLAILRRPFYVWLDWLRKDPPPIRINLPLNSHQANLLGINPQHHFPRIFLLELIFKLQRQRWTNRIIELKRQGPEHRENDE